MTNELPYEFDLHWDVKNMTDVEQIATGKPHRSAATPSDLVEMFKSLDMDVPECLNNVVDRWVIITKVSDGGINTAGKLGKVSKYDIKAEKYIVEFENGWQGWYTRAEFIFEGDEEEISPDKVRELILDHVKGLVGAFLYYDRKDDEDLCLYMIEKAVKDGVITAGKIGTEFNIEFNKAITTAIEELE